MDVDHHILISCETKELTMRVSRAQAEENRRTVISVASRLFRERGFDGIGLNDLMKGAGLTHGGFYKQFKSKDDLVIQACESAMDSNAVGWADVLTSAGEKPLEALVHFYLSDRHRQAKDQGCTLAALGSEAARRSPELRVAFERGIRAHLDLLHGLIPGEATGEVGGESRPSPSDKSLVTLATMVGALILSRAVNDEQLSQRFLDAATDSLLSDGSDQAT
jgi:TetR/AcrR family transcriptional repressor of nem operon